MDEDIEELTKLSQEFKFEDISEFTLERVSHIVTSHDPSARNEAGPSSSNGIEQHGDNTPLLTLNSSSSPLASRKMDRTDTLQNF